MKVSHWLTAGAILVVGCGDQPAKTPTNASSGAPSAAAPLDKGEAPDKVAVDVIKAVADGKVVAIWNALPPSYQKDITELVASSAAKADPEIWSKGALLAKKLLRVAKEKKEFILAHSDLKMLVQDSLQRSNAPIGFDVLAPNWNKAVDVLGALLDSELADPNKLKNIDMTAFLSGTGAKVTLQVMDVIRGLSPPGEFDKGLNKLRGASAAIARAGDGTVTVKFTFADETTPDDVTFVKVEGKWVPKSLADEWAGFKKQATEAIANISPSAEDKKQALRLLDAADRALDSLAAAKDSKEFDRKLEEGLMAVISGGAAAPPAGQVGAKPADAKPVPR